MFRNILRPQEPNDPQIQAADTQCEVCSHRLSAISCKAFPEGIPVVILVGLFDHTQPWIVNGEEADNGLRFEVDEQVSEP